MVIGIMPYPPLEIRFWNYVKKTDTCWLWTAKKYLNGYGSLMHDGKYKLAHRVSWELERGPIPNGLCVCHTCDVRECVNPDHLFTGTQKENMRDMVAKGRANPCRGESSYRSKLTNDDVIAIRSQYAGGALQKDIATAYGVSAKQVSVIVNRVQWAHI